MLWSEGDDGDVSVGCREVHGRANCNNRVEMNERGGSGGGRGDIDGVSGTACEIVSMIANTVVNASPR